MNPDTKEGCEWDFNVAPEYVDLERIWREAHNAPAIYFYSYMEQLYKHAPRTYKRLKDWCRERRLGSAVAWK